MGEIRASVKLRNAADILLREHGRALERPVRSTTIDAIIDTGAVVNLLPRDVVRELGLDIQGRETVTVADGRKVRLQRAGPFELTIAGRKWTTDCLVGPKGSVPLLGQLVLERLDLIVDPLRRTVAPRTARLVLNML